MGENGGLAEPYSGIYPLRKGFEVKGPDAGQQVILTKREGRSGQLSCRANGEGSISAGQRMGRRGMSKRIYITLMFQNICGRKSGLILIMNGI